MTRKKQTWMKPPQTPWTEEDWKAVHFCTENNIIISPMGINGERKWKIGIAVSNHKKVNYDKHHYDETQVWDKILEYNYYYYNKYKNDRESKEA